MDSFVQKGFVLLPLKPQPVSETSQCPAGAQVCLFLGLSALGAPSAWHRAKPAACAPPVCWGKDRQGAEEGWALWESGQEKHSLALPHRRHPCSCLGLAAIHPTSFSSYRAETKDSLSAFKILAIHCNTKYFLPSGYQYKLNLELQNTGPAPSLSCSARP